MPGSTLKVTNSKSPTSVESTSSADPRPRIEQLSKAPSVSSSNPVDRRASMPVQTKPGSVKLGIPSIAPPHPLPPRPQSVSSPAASSGTFGSLPTTASPLTNAQPGFANGRVPVSSNGLASNPSPSLINDSIPGLQGQFSIASRTPHSNKPLKLPSYSLKDVPKHGYSGNLDEMETLRRQELQARKAVLASRKPKLGAHNNLSKPSSAHSPSSVNPQNSSYNPLAPQAKSPTRPSSTTSEQKALVPVKIVDDFLKSITSGPSADSAGGDDVEGHTLTRSPESMEMDFDSNVHNGPSSAGSRDATWDSADLSAVHSSISNDLQSTSGFRHPLPSRRSSMKRPVASDFVDFDPTSRDSPYPPSMTHNGGSNNHSRDASSFTPNFANLAATRKVVIDFSDTEDEEDANGVNSQLDDGHHLSSHTPIVSSGSTSLRTSASSASTPEPVPALLTSVTPQALLLKEQEIKRMKEMIAEREKNRLKKLANLVR